MGERKLAFKQSLMRLLFLGSVWSLLLVSVPSFAETFRVTDIRLEGLQRVSAGTVFNLLPIEVGDVVDEDDSAFYVRQLFRSGYFHDVEMSREGGVLIVVVQERPAIDSITIEGNKAIETEALLEGLADQGLAEGEIFRVATLERMDLELERQYVAQGRYNATIDTTVEELPRNRVAISIDVVEGDSSKIRQINIVGNSLFDDAELLDQLELKHPNWLSFFRNDDKYSREKLAGDLEAIESFYHDQGYVDFSVTSAIVSITPSLEEVYITINVREGSDYTVGDVAIIGEIGDEDPDVLESLILVGEGDLYSQALVTASEERITAALGNSGYAFASVSGVPDTKDDGTADVKFFVDTGRRTYVRRISVTGNETTQDEVVRRELRQLEGGWASTALIDLSKVRLERLGYFSQVNLETPAVAGTDDQIDVNISVEEQTSGSIQGTIAYSDFSKLILGLGYSETNLFGTGNSFGINLNWSKFQQVASINYFNPYYTIDGISRGFSLYYRQTNYDEFNLVRYSSDSFGAGANYGIPIGETERLRFGFNVDYTQLSASTYTASEIREYLESEGDEALNLKLTGSYSNVRLNRGLFPTRGYSQEFGMEVSVPGSDTLFYKFQYEGQVYFPLPAGFTLKLRSKLGYGEAYGDTDRFPFFEHFFAGGYGSVRGFERYSLGPRTSPSEEFWGYDPDGDPLGGNMLVEGNAEIILPLPFIEDTTSFRPVFFFDVGNVFSTHCASTAVNCLEFAWDELRASTGLAFTWLSPMGPMTFSIAKVLREGPFDETESFQFELGRVF